MNKLSKAQIAEKTALQTKLSIAKQECDEQLSAANALIQQANELLDRAVGDYNAVLEEINGWREGIAADQESFYDEKSEKWQEGEKGSAYSEWKDLWSNEIEDATYEEPSELTIEYPEEEALNDDLFPDEPNQ